ncbi:hypothetical protein [Gimesia maris]|uniref:hypothetical protein n=1 Tax=Gimesia maris TaxID=122 RepID=UPI0012B732D1|nr:hypothetical protein [Gimesia maris]
MTSSKTFWKSNVGNQSAGVVQNVTIDPHHALSNNSLANREATIIRPMVLGSFRNLTLMKPDRAARAIPD